MDLQDNRPAAPKEQKPITELPAYTPGFGRRLLMFALCLIGLIIVWAFWWFHRGN